jgi:hypothetical protein
MLKKFGIVNTSNISGFLAIPSFFLIFYIDSVFFADSSGMLSIFYSSVFILVLYAAVRFEKISLRSFLSALIVFIVIAAVVYFFLIILGIVLLGISSGS